MVDGTLNAMRVAIDRSGRIVVPKSMRDGLGLVGPAELEIEEGDGQLVLRAVPSEVGLVERDGLLLVQRDPGVAKLDWEVVRDLVEHQRR